MAVNQASFFLFSPRFGPSVELDQSAGTALVGTILVDPHAKSVKTLALRDWLEARGFAELERYSGTSVLFFGRQKTPLGDQQEVVLSVPLDESEIEDLYIRFLLTERTPGQWNEWESLITSLGTDFGFKIMGPGDYPLPCSEFFALLTNNEHFRRFQAFYGWNVDRTT